MCVCLHRYKLVELAFYLTMGFFPASVMASMVIFWRISIIYSRSQFICMSHNTSSTLQGGAAMSVLLPLLAEVVYQQNDYYLSSVLLMNTSRAVSESALLCNKLCCVTNFNRSNLFSPSCRPLVVRVKTAARYPSCWQKLQRWTV